MVKKTKLEPANERQGVFWNTCLEFPSDGLRGVTQQGSTCLGCTRQFQILEGKQRRAMGKTSFPRSLFVVPWESDSPEQRALCCPAVVYSTPFCCYWMWTSAIWQRIESCRCHLVWRQSCILSLTALVEERKRMVFDSVITLRKKELRAVGSLRKMLLLWLLEKIEQLPIEVKKDEKAPLFILPWSFNLFKFTMLFWMWIKPS